MPISVSNRPLKNKMYVKCFLKGLFEAEMGIFFVQYNIAQKKCPFLPQISNCIILYYTITALERDQ